MMKTVLILSALVALGWAAAQTKHHIERFSCGKLYYRTFYLDSDNATLYVGSMDRIFKLATENINLTSCDKDALTLEPDNPRKCVSTGNSEEYECRNHIKVIQPMNNGRLYVCGTNARKPKDWVLYANLSRVQSPTPGIGDGAGKCPFSPDDNATAIWVEDGNPGNLPGLYSGTTANAVKTDRVIFRPELFDRETNMKKYGYMRTIRFDTLWLDKPEFVGSFDVGDHVYFFFRENAREAINCGKAVYSRVARVCKRDTGGAHVLRKNWVTFSKARLMCSIPGEYPFHFNEIQSVYKMPRDDRTFYAVFATPTNGVYGSALCAYSLDTINEAFEGRFKKQATQTSSWLPVSRPKALMHRSCANDTKTLPDSDVTFSRGHTLMDSAVKHLGGRPIYYRTNSIFTSIRVHRLRVKDEDHMIFYVGTSNGKILKVVQSNLTGTPPSNLLDTMIVAASEPIRALEISPEPCSLFAASDSGVVQIDLVMCRRRYATERRCSKDPYCYWDTEKFKCRIQPEAKHCRGTRRDSEMATDE